MTNVGMLSVIPDKGFRRSKENPNEETEKEKFYKSWVITYKKCTCLDI